VSEHGHSRVRRPRSRLTTLTLPPPKVIFAINLNIRSCVNVNTPKDINVRRARENVLFANRTVTPLVLVTHDGVRLALTTPPSSHSRLTFILKRRIEVSVDQEAPAMTRRLIIATVIERLAELIGRQKHFVRINEIWRDARRRLVETRLFLYFSNTDRRRHFVTII